MKAKRKAIPWWQLYLTAASGCLILFGEGLTRLSITEHHLILIITLIAIFWLMQQWLNDNRFRMGRSQAVQIVSTAADEKRPDDVL